jgi:hypothetical protein
MTINSLHTDRSRRHAQLFPGRAVGRGVRMSSENVTSIQMTYGVASAARVMLSAAMIAFYLLSTTTGHDLGLLPAISFACILLFRLLVNPLRFGLGRMAYFFLLVESGLTVAFPRKAFGNPA